MTAAGIFFALPARRAHLYFCNQHRFAAPQCAALFRTARLELCRGGSSNAKALCVIIRRRHRYGGAGAGRIFCVVEKRRKMSAQRGAARTPPLSERKAANARATASWRIAGGRGMSGGGIRGERSCFTCAARGEDENAASRGALRCCADNGA